MDNGASSYRRYLNGDDSAITQIVSLYKDGLILYLNGYVKNIYLAEELCEDTFFKLITKKPKFREKSSFKTFIYSIARNTAVDYIRKNSKIIGTPIDDIENCIADERSLENSYIKTETKIFVHRAMCRIHSDYQNIIWLIYFEGLSNKEAAKILKKTDRQITDLLYRAKKSLKYELRKEGFVYEELN